MVELDIRKTADKRFVCIHDDNTWRTAKRAENLVVANSTFEQLRAIELAETYGVLDRVQPFCSIFGPQAYGLPIPTETITLVKKPWQVPQQIHGIVPFLAGETMQWQVAS